MKRLAKWIQRLRKGFVIVPVAAAPLEADWTPNDAVSWKRIIESPIGKKFVSRARAVHYGMACNQKLPKKTAHGFAECVNWTLSLARVQAPPEQKQDAVEAATDAQMAAYLERLRA